MTTVTTRRLNAVNEKSEEDIGVDFTVMAIRECLMSYFKGDCVRNVIPSNVHLRPAEIPHLRYSYQRQQANQRNPVDLVIGGVYVISLQKMPYRIHYYDHLDRSPQLRKVKFQTMEFVNKYLRAVEQNNVTTLERSASVDDSKLVKQNIPSAEMADLNREFQYTSSSDTDFQIQWETSNRSWGILYNDNPDVTEEDTL